MTTYIVKVGRQVDAPVKIGIKEGGGITLHEFTLVCRRPSHDEVVQMLSNITDGVLADREFLLQYVIDWRGQRLVVDENDQPAPFNEETFSLMLTVAGVQPICARAALRAITTAARDAAAEKQKN